MAPLYSQQVYGTPLTREEVAEQIYKIDLDERVIRLNNKLCENNPREFWTRQCDLCNGTFDNATYRNFCGSPYCDDDHCQRSRTSLKQLLLKSYFLSEKKFRNKHVKWLHGVLGMERTNKITKDVLQSFRKNINNFLNGFTKEYGKIPIIGIIDISRKDLNEKFYLHFHFAFRVYGIDKLDYNMLNDVAFNNNLKFNSFGFKKPRPLAKYFAKRLSGLFEHEANKTSWKFSDEFTPKEFIDVFYRVKLFMSKNFNRVNVKITKEQLKKFGDQASVYNASIGSNIPNNHKPNLPRKSCQHCGNRTFTKIMCQEPPDPNPGQKINANQDVLC